MMSEKKGKFEIGILFLCLTVAFMGATVGFSKKAKETKVVLAEVRAEVASAKEKNKLLEEKVNELNKQVESLQAEKESLSAQIEEQGLKEEVEDAKYAYLTFDDGPSSNTVKILDFLKANHIKATFFVLGKEDQGDIYRRIVDEGHTIAIHSNTHDYSTIYQSVDNFMKDVNELSELIQKETGVKPDVLRFPGGSNNTVSHKYGGNDVMDQIIPAVNEAGYVYFDWNVDSQDASKSKQDTSVIVDSVLSGAQNKHEAIILMHDASAKTTTVEALPSIVEGLREQGFVFKSLSTSTEPVQFAK